MVCPAGLVLWLFPAAETTCGEANVVAPAINVANIIVEVFIVLISCL